MQELRQKLVTIHAQHESRTLLSPQSQLELIDALGDQEHKNLLSSLRTLNARRKQLEAELEEMQESEADRERRLDFARFQLSELQEAELEDPEEDEQVSRQKSILSNVSELESLLANAQGYFRGDDQEGAGILELLQKAIAELSRASQMDEGLSPVLSALNDALERLDDEARTIRKYSEGLEADPETLANLEERAATLATIKRKYGPALIDAIRRQQELEEEIEKLSNISSAMNDLQAELYELNTELIEVANLLSSKRKSLATELSQKIQQELSELGMSNCVFEIALSGPSENADRITLLDAIGPNGLDKAEFLICPNPGQPLLPVAKIASGGELSRVMLAVKTIFAGAERVPTVIFDEIDTGLSGKVLQTMRDKLAKLARSQQILCVTHQPIIASVADNHIYVNKDQDESSTRTRVRILDEANRLKALAGMAGGEENQEAALKFASALYQESSKLKVKFADGCPPGS
jgi:DNA repair protein RecN (Recombination protein N)